MSIKHGHDSKTAGRGKHYCAPVTATGNSRRACCPGTPIDTEKRPLLAGVSAHAPLARVMESKVMVATVFWTQPFQRSKVALSMPFDPYVPSADSRSVEGTECRLYSSEKLPPNLAAEEAPCMTRGNPASGSTGSCETHMPSLMGRPCIKLK